ncbi:uL13 family ribosomal protein [Candidatus Vidania fulgoroideorum]
MKIDLSKNSLGRNLSILSKLINNIFLIKGINSLKKINNIIFFNKNNIKIKGKKKNNKLIYKHTGFLGGLKKKKYYDHFYKDIKIIKNSLKNMICKNFVFNIIKNKITLI